MPITTIRTIFQIEKRTILYPPHLNLVGSSLYGLATKPAIYLYDEKKSLHQPYFWAGGFDVWGFFRSIVKIQEQKPLSIPQYAEKEQPFP